MNLDNIIKNFNKKTNKNFDSLFYTDLTFMNKVKRLSFKKTSDNEFVNELIKYIEKQKERIKTK